MELERLSERVTRHEIYVNHDQFETGVLRQRLLVLLLFSTKAIPLLAGILYEMSQGGCATALT